MQFNIGRVEFLNALSKVEKALGQKELSGVRIMASDILTLSATNRDISIEVEIKELDIVEVGEVLIYGKLLTDLVRKSDAKVINIESVDNKTKIKAGRSKFSLNNLDMKNFPTIKEQKWDTKFSLGSNDLKSLIKKTTFAVSISNTRPILQGVNFKIKDNKLYVYATDSYRVAKDYIEIDSDISLDVIIPATSLNELAKIIDTEKVEIKINSFYASFEFENTVFQARLIEGAFPDIENLINIGNIATYKVNKNSLISALERANIIIGSMEQQIVQMDLKGNLVAISTLNSEVGQVYEEMEANGSGEELVMALSIKYFSEALKTFESVEVELLLSGEVKPMRIVNDKEKVLQLILPVRRV